MSEAFSKGPISLSFPQETPPSRNDLRLIFNLCDPLEYESSQPAQDQCPKGTRGCLSVINAKEGEQDRITQVVPVIVPTEEKDEGSVRWDAEQESASTNGESESTSTPFCFGHAADCRL